MRLPNTLGIIFLVTLLVWTPLLALRSRARLVHRAGSDGKGNQPKPIPSRVKILRGTLLMLLFMFWLSWLTGRTFDYPIFAANHIGGREWALGVAAFAIVWGVVRVSRVGRTRADEKKLAIYLWMPQTAGERALFVATCFAAGIAEETAYRGVGMALLTWTLGGNALLSALLLSVAFAVAHAVQGWRSGIAIFVVAALMHLLVWLTDTLVIAMVVHTVYDIVAGLRAGRAAARFAREDAANDHAVLSSESRAGE